MRLFDASLIVIGIIVGICALVGLTSQLWMGKDNVIEQECEEVIKEETGIVIDLSP